MSLTDIVKIAHVQHFTDQLTELDLTIHSRVLYVGIMPINCLRADGH